MPSIREIAERVLTARTLREKLHGAPHQVSDEQRECSMVLPSSPGRPKELEISAKGVQVDFPGTNKLDDTAERGKMLHFLANHELLATELMALALLKFPNAPEEFRRGVYETMREEQAHTLMYMRRMKSCGMEFGELPVNDYFWRMVSTMECPMDFVARLSLVFEQANLDYSLHYGKLFREVGDGGTARVLETIYDDEIGHVGHGLKWFRKWKDAGLTDWAAYKKTLFFPMTVARGKGMVPFNAEGRRAAGLDEEWIREIEVAEQSRGRTPVVHWFNPNAESVAAHEVAKERGVARGHFTSKKRQAWLEEDLEVLPIAWAKKDDVVLVRQKVSYEHHKTLRDSGFIMPEFVELGGDDQLKERKLSGFSPWAWTRDACERLAPYAAGVPTNMPKQWRAPIPTELFSKQFGVKIAEEAGETYSLWLTELAEIVDVETGQLQESLFRGMRGLNSWPQMEELGVNAENFHNHVLLKAPFSSAGRGHVRLGTAARSEEPNDKELTPSQLGWLRRIIEEQGGVVVEWWQQRSVDFSAQYEVNAQGAVQFQGMTRLLNDANGHYLGTFVCNKWTRGLSSDLARYLFHEASALSFYRDELPKLIEPLLQEHHFDGNFSIDAYVADTGDENHPYLLRKIVELNPRMTMGRVAHELLKKSGPGKAGVFQILRKSRLGEDCWKGLRDREFLDVNPMHPQIADGLHFINDPVTAREFVALWCVGKNDKEIFGLIEQFGSSS